VDESTYFIFQIFAWILQICSDYSDSTRFICIRFFCVA